MHSIHRFSIEGIQEQHIRFADFAGKKIVVVNVASECGYTPQYAQLQELDAYFEEKLVVVGVPCNDFGGQEPGTEAEIAAFCKRSFGVSFPLAAKMRIKAPDTAPLYQWLTQQRQNGVLDAEVKWNFHKFLLDEAGILLAHFPASVSPLDDAILSFLTADLPS